MILIQSSLFHAQSDAIVAIAGSEIQTDMADGSLRHRPLQAPHPPLGHAMAASCG